MRAIEDGGWSPVVAERLQALEGQKAALAAELAHAAPTPVLRLHPRLPELYAATVGRLQEALADDTIKDEAMATLRGLIDKVVLTPEAAASAGLKAEFYGDVALVLAIGEAERSPNRPSKLAPAPASQPQTL